MTDGIIKGTGNSRYLKSVPNALTLYPSFEAFMEAMIAGTFPIDLNGINPSGWETQGDKLNKATLLTDALCSALGLANTATPTQAMEKLRQLTATAQTGVNNGVKIVTGSYVGNGKMGSANPSSLVFSFSPLFILISAESINFSSYLAPLAWFPGIKGNNLNNSSYAVYITYTGNGISWYHLTNASYQRNDNGTTYYYMCIGK